MSRPTLQQGNRGGVAALLVVLFLGLATPAHAQQVKAIDPSGQWQGLHGVLSLMLNGDALSFSYSAVFGATAHLCDGVGVAGQVANGQYHYADGQGTVAFIVTGEGVKMRTVSGIASFCGANWPGDEFTSQGYKSLQGCTVSDPKAYFHAVMRAPPTRQQAYVLKGDRVEVVPACFEGGDAWVMARFQGSRGATIGLLKKEALDCPE
jgi:hypothetical protein